MKDLIISKELISEVLSCDCVKIDIKNNTLEYDCDFDDVVIVRNINIYEFAFKCKEWAFKNNYKIQSQINESNKGHSHITKKNDDCWAKGFFENTEIKVILKACEFILIKKESK